MEKVITPYQQWLIDRHNAIIDHVCGELDISKMSGAVKFYCRKFRMWGIDWESHYTAIKAREKFKHKIRRKTKKITTP